VAPAKTGASAIGLQHMFGPGSYGTECIHLAA